MTPIAAYLLVLGWASIPFAPAEPVLVGAGSYAAIGALHLPFVIAAAAAGSLASDLAKYAIGRAAGPAMLERLRRRESGARAVDWIESRARRIGPAVIVPSYFVPFGVVAATLLCGALRMRLGPVAAASAVGAALWSAMFVLLGCRRRRHPQPTDRCAARAARRARARRPAVPRGDDPHARLTPVRRSRTRRPSRRPRTRPTPRR